MIGYVQVSPAYLDRFQLHRLLPSGVRLLAALDRVAQADGIVLELTCGNEGHPPEDPHTLGKALDVSSRTHGSTAAKVDILKAVLAEVLDDGTDKLEPLSPLQFATRYFFGQIEDLDGPNEHFHLQQRKGRDWPAVIPPDGTVAA